MLKKQCAICKTRFNKEIEDYIVDSFFCGIESFDEIQLRSHIKNKTRLCFSCRELETYIFYFLKTFKLLHDIRPSKSSRDFRKTLLFPKEYREENKSELECFDILEYVENPDENLSPYEVVNNIRKREVLRVREYIQNICSLWGNDHKKIFLDHGTYLDQIRSDLRVGLWDDTDRKIRKVIEKKEKVIEKKEKVKASPPRGGGRFGKFLERDKINE